MSSLGDESLRDADTRYREMIESVNEVVFSTDTALCFTFLNKAWERFTGYPVGTSIGQSLLAYLHPDDRLKAEAPIRAILKGDNQPSTISFRLTSRQGDIRWIQATLRPTLDDGRREAPTGLFGTLSDITARKVAELTLKNLNQELEIRVRQRTAELEASNRELEAFSYSVSHDLRSPLRAIDGFARILEEELGERLDPGSREHLERIRLAAGRMAYLIDKLIELARLSRHMLRKETVNLSDLAIQVIEDLRREHPERQVDVEIMRDLTATADPTLMHNVLDNLLRNAWKFTARQPVARIGFHAAMHGGERIFTVSDDGVGFDMAFSKQLFRAFHRLHDIAEFPGSGIGLANVQRVIQRHGGEIWAESAPGKGAAFHFTLDG